MAIKSETPDGQSPLKASKYDKLEVSTHKLEEKASIEEVTIIGANLAKNVRKVYGAASDGSVLLWKELARSRFTCFAISRD